jgi:hypothetical protein
MSASVPQGVQPNAPYPGWALVDSGLHVMSVNAAVAVTGAVLFAEHRCCSVIGEGGC